MVTDDIAPATSPADALDRLRGRGVRVHCITNSVVEGFVANALLAAGCIPSMTTDPGEVPDFVARADALAINLGTLDGSRRAAIDAAINAATMRQRAAAVPWVLDPVFVDRSPSRRDVARGLVDRRPDLLRANTAELAALAGADDADAETAIAFARRHGVAVAMTGERDVVSDGRRTVAIANGHPLLARVTGAGCATTALMAGFLAVEPDPVAAAVACLATVGVAAELAAARAEGPGSFVPAFLDILHSLPAATLAARARIEATGDTT